MRWKANETYSMRSVCADDIPVYYIIGINNNRRIINMRMKEICEVRTSQDSRGSPLDNQDERRILPLEPQRECVYGGQAE